MASLLERVGELSDRLRRLDQLGSEKALLERLQTRAQQVEEASTAVEVAYRSSRVLDKAGISIGRLPSPSIALRQKPRQLLAELGADWREFVNDNDIKNTFVDRVEGHASRINDILLERWRAHIQEGLPDISEEFLSAFASAGFHEECGRLRDLRVEVGSLRNALPARMEDCDALAKLKAEINEVWTGLKGVPVEVIAFLRKASSRQASFDDLSEIIQSWLREHGVLPKLRIGLG
jgi:hypothetical protein